MCRGETFTFHLKKVLNERKYAVFWLLIVICFIPSWSLFMAPTPTRDGLPGARAHLPGARAHKSRRVRESPPFFSCLAGPISLPDPVPFTHPQNGDTY